MGEELQYAYAKYLERMLQKTDELSVVDEDTIPWDANVPVVEEWADIA